MQKLCDEVRGGVADLQPGVSADRLRSIREFGEETSGTGSDSEYAESFHTHSEVGKP